MDYKRYIFKPGDRVRYLPSGTWAKMDGLANKIFTVFMVSISGDETYVYPAEVPNPGQFNDYAMHFKLVQSDLVSDCECGNKNNPIGQGHSQWCKMFKSEF